MENVKAYNHLHKPGDKVQVYQDPITKRCFEGNATIKKLRNVDHYYEVEFYTEPGRLYPRFVY